MTAVLLDTHAWVWSFWQDSLLSQPARAAILKADAVMVSPISFFEIGQKVRIGKWPDMSDRVRDLPGILQRQGGLQAPFTAAICLEASLWDWVHRDPFDRLIAATAKTTGAALITRDPVFHGLDGVAAIW